MGLADRDGRLQDEHPQALHVEAVSVRSPLEITDAPGRLQLRVQERADRQGWNLGGEIIGTAGIWYRQRP
jgi:hypothetical protein